MTIAEASQSRLAYVPEATPGVIPATPSFQTLREVSENIRLAKQTVVSDEIRSDGNVSSIIDVGRNIEGTLSGEFSYGTYDELLAGLFRSDWSSNVLKNAMVAKTFTLEKRFKHSPTESYLRYRGCRVNSLDLNLETRSIIRSDLGFMGLGSPAATSAIITGATYAAASVSAVMNSGTNIGQILIGGIAQNPKIRSGRLSFRSNLAANDVIGQYEPDSHVIGRFDVTGSLQIYFEGLDVYNAIVGHADVSLTLTLGASSGNKYTLLLPKAKLMDGSPVIGGNGQAVVMDVPFTAYYDSGIDATAQLTRAVV